MGVYVTVRVGANAAEAEPLLVIADPRAAKAAIRALGRALKEHEQPKAERQGRQ